MVLVLGGCLSSPAREDADAAIDATDPAGPVDAGDLVPAADSSALDLPRPAGASLVAVPSSLDFGIVEPGCYGVFSLELFNVGLQDLAITAATPQGPDGFSLQWPCPRPNGGSADPFVLFSPVPVPLDESVCSSPVVVPAGESRRITVRYFAVDSAPSQATLTFLSNDPRFDADSGEGVVVPLQANQHGACLRVEPPIAMVGGVAVHGVGQKQVDLVNCGDRAVTIDGVSVALGAAAGFSLGFGADPAPSPQAPWVLPPSARQSFNVVFGPDAVEPPVEGHATLSRATILVRNDSPRPQIEVPVTALAFEAGCGVAGFRMTAPGKTVLDGDEVPVLTRVELDDQSYDSTPGGSISQIEWQVDAPPGSASVFNPNRHVSHVSFELNVVGTYTFRLVVRNSFGCEAETVMTVRARPPQGCKVELTWTTPADLDPTDSGCTDGKSSCGSDMDLHVVHPFAQGDKLDPEGKPYGFFDATWDVYWMNSHPTWRPDHAGDPLYQPALDRDDTNGWGPEAFSCVYPEPGVCFRLGVHYFDDHGFGASYPTIRVFADTAPVFERVGPRMKMLDLWDVGELCCTDAAAPVREHAAPGGGPAVVPNYQAPGLTR